MTPEQLELVRRTVPDLEAHADEFATSFYGRLFALAPETRALVPDEMSQQLRKFVDEVSFAGMAVADLPVFVERARDLGARHHRYGVRPSHYEVAEQALLGALADVLGPAWSPATMFAWQRLYRLMAETMLEGSAGPSFGSTA
jgi:hemoglobin-like flavoprotein